MAGRAAGTLGRQSLAGLRLLAWCCLHNPEASRCSPLQDGTDGEMGYQGDDRWIRNGTSWSTLWPSPVSRTFGPLLYLLEPQRKCAASGEITLGAGLVQICCVVWAGSLDPAGPLIPLL